MSAWNLIRHCMTHSARSNSVHLQSPNGALDELHECSVSEERLGLAATINSRQSNPKSDDSSWRRFLRHVSITCEYVPANDKDGVDRCFRAAGDGRMPERGEVVLRCAFRLSQLVL
jgi:hypothetical protein